MTEVASKKWAKALMELAQEDENLSKENILSDLRSIATILNESDELSSVFFNPAISVEEKQIVICKLFQEKVMPIVYNFIFVLNLRKRLNLISEIANEYEKELEELKNVIRVNITSAVDINDEKKAEIKKRIEEKLQKESKISWNVDSDIIAGLIFNIDEIVIDNSIKHRLETLSNLIIKG